MTGEGAVRVAVKIAVATIVSGVLDLLAHNECCSECCSECCAMCHQLLILEENGMLDVIIAQHPPADTSWWVNGQVDREWLRSRWTCLNPSVCSDPSIVEVPRA